MKLKYKFEFYFVLFFVCLFIFNNFCCEYDLVSLFGFVICGLLIDAFWCVLDYWSDYASCDFDSSYYRVDDDDDADRNDDVDDVTKTTMRFVCCSSCVFLCYDLVRIETTTRYDDDYYERPLVPLVNRHAS